MTPSPLLRPSRAARPRVGALILGILATALALAPRAPAAPPDREPAWAQTIRNAIVAQDQEIGRTSAAAVMRKLESALSRQSGQADPVTLYLLARAYAKIPDVPSALTTYGEAIKAQPGNWFAWRDRGVVRAQQQDNAGAEADYRQAVTLKPDFVDALQPLGVLFVETKRFDEGIKLFQRVLDYEPTRESARLQIVEALILAGRPDPAMAALAPVLEKAPKDPMLRTAKARILSVKGDHAGAQEIFRQIAREYPDNPGPLKAWLREVALSKTLDPDETIDVLERLRRVARTADERKAYDAQIAGIRKQMAEREAPKDGPPSPATLARVLRQGDAKQRESAMLYVLRAPPDGFAIEGDLLLALVERLDPVREPVPAARLLALRVLARFPDRQMAAVVRGSLRDPDPQVRCIAADALGAMGNPLAIAVLHRFAVAPEPEVATSARVALYTLAKAPPPDADPTPEAQAAAFAAWWKGPGARDGKLAALDAIVTSADLAPDELVFQFALDPDPVVWPAAVKALRRLVPAAPQGASPKATWMRTLPAIDDARLVPAQRDAVLAQLLSWWEKRPK